MSPDFFFGRGGGVSSLSLTGLVSATASLLSPGELLIAPLSEIIKIFSANITYLILGQRCSREDTEKNFHFELFPPQRKVNEKRQTDKGICRDGG